MYKIICTLLFLILGLTACENEIYKEPDNLIPPEKMAEIIEDIHIGDAILSDQRAGTKDIRTLSKYYYASIYKKHGITRKQFDESLKFYTSKSIELDKIYEIVANSLSKKEKLLMEVDRKK